MKTEVDQIIDLLNEIKQEVNKIEDNQLKENGAVNNLYVDSKIVIRQLEFLRIKEKKFTEQLFVLTRELLNNYYSQIDSIFRGYYSDMLQKYTSLENLIKSLENELKRIDYLSLIKENNVILVGGNGVGKSSFASYLKDSMSDNIVVIPAQKFLFYDKSISSLHLTSKLEINTLQKQNYIGRGKFYDNSDVYAVQRFTRELTELFSRLVTVIVNDQIESEHNLVRIGDVSEESKKDTILYKLNELWSYLIPDIVFDLDTTNRMLEPIKKGQPYSLNSMSDGEKAMVYYICQVFLAEENSFIVVDEPETFLNVSNFNRLWDTLESYRQDCKFIYISHVIDFISTRANADLLWCKGFSYPDSWEITSLEYDSDLSEKFPKQLLSEILGVRKPILFCEGKKDGLDYLVYTSLFKNELIVCPVGGHSQVIQYTRAYNNSPILQGNKAYGIVDNDLMTDSQICTYKEEGIFTLPFNEIEMLFLTKEVMVSVLKNVFPDDEVQKKLNDFQQEFFKSVNNGKVSVIQQKMKKYMDNQLSNFRIDNAKTSKEMAEEVTSWISALKIEELENRSISQLDQIIDKKEYDELLKVCPQKKEISKGLANKLLDNNYEHKAKNRLKIDAQLAHDIRTMYFPHMIFKD